MFWQSELLVELCLFLLPSDESGFGSYSLKEAIYKFKMEPNSLFHSKCGINKLIAYQSLDNHEAIVWYHLDWLYHCHHHQILRWQIYHLVHLLNTPLPDRDSYTAGTSMHTGEFPLSMLHHPVLLLGSRIGELRNRLTSFHYIIFLMKILWNNFMTMCRVYRAVTHNLKSLDQNRSESEIDSNRHF